MFIVNSLFQKCAFQSLLAEWIIIFCYKLFWWHLKMEDLLFFALFLEYADVNF